MDIVRWHWLHAVQPYNYLKHRDFKRVTSPKYQCAVFCVMDLIKLQEVLAHLLVFKITEFLEQPFRTWLLQTALGVIKHYFK